MNVYLDNAATCPLSNSTKEYLISLLDMYGNPSSLYSLGEEAKHIINKARINTANFINANINDIYFTSSGSASNTLAIKGFSDIHDWNIFYSPIAHKSILKCIEKYKNKPLKVNNCGLIDLQELEYDIVGRKAFVVIDYANSEIGTIQNVKELIDIVHFYNGIVYLDCTGSISTIPLDVKKLDVDMCGFSAHKLGGLKGCGVLYKKSHIQLEPLIYGTQEKGLVGGTENILGIASLGKVIEDFDYPSISSRNRDYVYDYIIKNIPDCYLIGTLSNRLPHNLYMCFKNINGESLMLSLDMEGIQVSTGSACNSKSLSPSTALFAIGVDDKDIHSCIRFSFSGNETNDELDYICQTLEKNILLLRELNKK